MKKTTAYMKRLLIASAFSVLAAGHNYSQENISLLQYSDNRYYDQFGIRALGDLSTKFLFPFIGSNEPVALAFFDMGLGVGIDILPYLLSPGIYVDLALGLDWLWLFGLGSESSYTNNNAVHNQFALAGGVRVYNMIKILDFCITPFFGYNFLYFILPLPNAGISISIKDFALEYAYYFPTDYEPSRHHHIAVKLTLTDYWYSFWDSVRN